MVWQSGKEDTKKYYFIRICYQNEREECFLCKKQVQKMYMKMHKADHKRKDKMLCADEISQNSDIEESATTNSKRKAAKRFL